MWFPLQLLLVLLRHSFNSWVSNGKYLLSEYLQMLLQDDGTALPCSGFQGECPQHNEMCQQTEKSDQHRDNIFSKGPCSSAKQFTNFRSGEAVLQDLDAAGFWTPYNSLLLLLLTWISFVLFSRMYCIFIKYHQDDTPSYLYFWTMFFKCTENSQILKTECDYLAQGKPLNTPRENVTVNWYYHSHVCEDFKVWSFIELVFFICAN